MAATKFNYGSVTAATALAASMQMAIDIKAALTANPNITLEDDYQPNSSTHYLILRVNGANSGCASDWFIGLIFGSNGVMLTAFESYVVATRTVSKYIPSPGMTVPFGADGLATNQTPTVIPTSVQTQWSFLPNGHSSYAPNSPIAASSDWWVISSDYGIALGVRSGGTGLGNVIGAQSYNSLLSSTDDPMPIVVCQYNGTATQNSSACAANRMPMLSAGTQILYGPGLYSPAAIHSSTYAWGLVHPWITMGNQSWTNLEKYTGKYPMSDVYVINYSGVNTSASYGICRGIWRGVKVGRANGSQPSGVGWRDTVTIDGRQWVYLGFGDLWMDTGA